jgi:alginate O-acetyltransferase complex protein AlgI
MLFHSYDYLVFFLLVLVAYWSLPRRGQNLLLLVASYFFYGYVHQWYLILIFFTSNLEWFTANRMVDDPKNKKRYLTFTLCVNFGILCSLKYLDFFSGGNALKILQAIGFRHFTQHDVALLLPVGISFYTFQSVSYLVDVYRGEMKVKKEWSEYLLFACFFPQLVAGPIERAWHLMRQIEMPRIFDARIARGAIVLILWGYFKKLTIADNAALITNKVFSLDQPPWPILWAGVFAFAIQIFADFSAYTDIARGSARLMGFDLMQNFNHPYLATSPPDFWRRWHISLSTWFRDYVYIPLGGGRRSNGRVAFNIMLTFFLSGLWHGASWNYIMWGCYHGLLLVIWRQLEKGPALLRPSAWPKWPQILLTFALVNLGWLMFRETNTQMLLRYLSLNPFAASWPDWQGAIYLFSQVCFYCWPLAAHAALDHWMEKRPNIRQEHYPQFATAQIILATLLLFGIIALGSPSSSDFIYFQF